VSGTEQTWNWVGGTSYGNGTYGLGSAQKHAAADNPFYDPGLSITAADFQEGVLRAQLIRNWNGRLGSGVNNQFGPVDMTFGFTTELSENQPPLITRTTIGGEETNGYAGSPAGGFVPNPSSPTNESTSPTDIPKAPNGSEYAEKLPSSGKGSTLSPGDVDIAADGVALVGTGLVKGMRPGRTGVDEANGAS